MYIIPSNSSDTAIVVSQGKPVTNSIKKYLLKLGKQFYFVVNSETDELEEKLKMPVC